VSRSGQPELLWAGPAAADHPPSAPPGAATSPAPGPAHDAAGDDALTARANALALAYQGGQTDALPTLVELLRPLIRSVLYRFLRGAPSLPASLDREDLYQQSWLILDGLARRWDPAGGDFPAYVRVTFLWELWRYVRALSPSRRARRVRVDNVQHDTLLDRMEDHAGTDGRRWDDQLIVAELLSDLDPIARWVLLLHTLEEQPFHDVARALRLTQAGTYRAYRRALDQLRLRAGLELDPDDVLANRSGGPPAIERLVTVLHEGASLSGRLPGRTVVCARANISEARFARLMGLLATRGCIVERSTRKTGRLVHATVEQTLSHLRRQLDSDADPLDPVLEPGPETDPDAVADRAD
jgi:RNA polymerase sigma factor (sigma-70 family)